MKKGQITELCVYTDNNPKGTFVHFARENRVWLLRKLDQRNADRLANVVNGMLAKGTLKAKNITFDSKNLVTVRYVPIVNYPATSDIEHKAISEYMNRLDNHQWYEDYLRDKYNTDL